MRRNRNLIKLRNCSELQVEAQGITNDITPVSGSLVKETVEIELKIEGARPDGAGTLGMVPQLEKGCRTRLRFYRIELL